MNALKRIKSRGYTLKDEYKRAYKEQTIELIDSKKLAKDQGDIIRSLRAELNDVKADYSTLLKVNEQEEAQEEEAVKLKLIIWAVIIWAVIIWAVIIGMIIGMLI